MRSTSKEDKVWSEFDMLEHELGGDIVSYVQSRTDRSSQTWRRAYCRAVSAYLEALTNWMARYTIHFYYPGQIGAEEKARLEARLSAMERAFHALDLFNSTVGTRSPFRRQSAEWQLLSRLTQIRNRLMHPKCGKDIIVSDADLEIIEGAARMVILLISESLERSARALVSQYCKLKRVLRKRGCAKNETDWQQ